jgi:hypothetical protein
MVHEILTLLFYACAQHSAILIDLDLDKAIGILNTKQISVKLPCDSINPGASCLRGDWR